MSSHGSDPSETPEPQPASAERELPAGEPRDPFLARKKAMLAAWVARLNMLRNNGAYRAIERRISRMLGEVEAEEKRRGPSPISLEKQIDTWLASNAGKVGGPEQEQDPTRPHSPGWHGDREDPPIAQQQR